MSMFKKKINEFPTPYTCKNAVKKGGVETKLSMILMGFGNIVHGQIIKGLLYLAIEIAYIVFMAVNGIGFIGGLRTLELYSSKRCGMKQSKFIFTQKGISPF